MEEEAGQSVEETLNRLLAESDELCGAKRHKRGAGDHPAIALVYSGCSALLLTAISSLSNRSHSRCGIYCAASWRTSGEMIVDAGAVMDVNAGSCGRIRRTRGCFPTGCRHAGCGRRRECACVNDACCPACLAQNGLTASIVPTFPTRRGVDELHNCPKACPDLPTTCIKAGDPV